MDPAQDTLGWKEKDLMALKANAVEEGPNLEYKGPESLQNTPERKRELCKDVTAFANSAGGTIIYGMREDKAKRVPETIAGVDPKVISKEWIEHVIAGNTQPRPTAHIHPVELPKADPGKVAYIVVIPQGETAHMSLPHKQYFKRYEFESVLMSDFEVRDVMNRRRHPLLEAEFTAKRYQIATEKHSYKLNVMLKNKGTAVIQNWKVLYRIPVDMVIYPEICAPERTIPEEGLAEFELGRAVVIFPQEQIQFDGARLCMTDQLYRTAKEKNFCLKWRIYADDMPYKEGSIPLLDLISF